MVPVAYERSENFMQKEKSDELSKMFSYAGNYHKLTILGCILAGISTIFSMLPFVCIWFVIRDLIHGLSQGDVTLATGSSHYAWMALLFSVLSIFLYFLALIFSHLAAFRTATNMRKKAIHHIVELPLGYFSQNTSGRLRKVIDDNAGLTEGFLAHQLPDLTGAVVMPVAVIILIFVFDWRMGICCLIPMAVSVIFLKQMMGGDNADFMSKYMTALETMNKEAVEYIRGIPVVKVFQQTIHSFKNFHNAITEYEKFASGYALKCRIPMTGFTVALNSTFVLLIPAAMIILSGLSGQISYEETVLDFLFYALFTPVCTTMMNRIMFASEQLMAAKSAVSRVEAVIQEKTLPEAAQKQKPADTGIVFNCDPCGRIYPALSSVHRAAYVGTYEESARRRIHLAEKLRTLPLGFFHQRDLSNLTSTIMGDCASFEHAFSYTVPQFWGAVISTGIVCIGLLIFNWQMESKSVWKPYRISKPATRKKHI